MKCVTLKTSELTVVIGNNEAGDAAHEAHRARYNGIWSLSSVHAPENCFVPSYAGLNLEHLMDALTMSEESGDDYEPRTAPMRCEQLDEHRVALIQDTPPLTGVHSVSTFAVSEPNIIDFTFEATFTKAPRVGNRFGFFWASYMNAPDAPSLHFIDARDQRWVGLFPDAHGRNGGNVVCHEDEPNPTWGLDDYEYRPGSLAHSISQRRFGKPVMFGRPGDGRMVFVQMFDQDQPVRLTMSPSGGGNNEGALVRNPAWDFQYIVEDPQPGQTVRLRSRVVYRPYTSIQDVVSLYDDYQASLA